MVAKAIAASILAATVVVVLAAQTRINPTDPQPTCNMCPGYYIPLSELQAYTKKAIDENLLEHDQVSEVYHIIDGTATLVLGPDITNRQRRPSTLRTVVEFNGPGNNGSEIRNGKTYQLKPGDVVVIPAGTGHLFTRIDDHIDYLMVRIDPDKVTPTKDEPASKTYLSKPASREP
jgi:mannose-6-phosphate isomerase-like protein (cupin superfamily)